MHQVNVHGPGDVRLDAAEPPSLGERDAIVRIEACGICGTDLSYIKAGGSRHGVHPRPLGHEAAGRVIAIGSQVEGVELGKHVLINPMGTSNVIGCGGPEGAFTEELLVRDAAAGRSLIAVPEGLSSEYAALAEPLSVAMHGVNRSGATSADKVVVFGCGAVGLGVIMWLRHKGVENVVAIDIVEGRLSLARAMGATATIRADRENVQQRLFDLHGTVDVMGRPAVATNVYIDAAGAPNILPDVVGMARTHARLVVIAAHRQPVALDLSAMLLSEMSITTSLGYPDELEMVLNLLPSIQDKLALLITHRVPFDRVIDAFDVARSPDSAKVMVYFDAQA